MSALGIDTMLLLPSLKLLYPAPRKEHGFLPPCFSSPKPSSSCSCSSLKAVFSVSCRKTQYFRPSSVCLVRRVRAKASEGQSSSLEEEKEEAEEPEFQVVSAVRSNYNEIVIVDTPDSRVLLLDSTHNVHSIFRKGQKWTGSYWDEFASLPAIVPHGPIAILGLGGGTAAHLMLELWPSLKLEGWEIDAILIDKAREYLGLSDLEKCTEAGGVLHVHVGDALSPLAVVPGGFAGIVVDLFSDGKVLPQLQEVETWLEMKNKLLPHGRIMVNCAGVHSDTYSNGYGITYPNLSSTGSAWAENSTIKALYKAFPGMLSWKRMAEAEGENYLALTGPFPDLDAWSSAVPGSLSLNVKKWRPCGMLS